MTDNHVPPTASHFMNPNEDIRIDEHSTVDLHFSVALENGVELDNTRIRAEPVSLTMGDGNLLPGFENALFGLKAGDKRSLPIMPEQGFGQPNPQNQQIMPRSQFKDMELTEGLLVIFNDAAKAELPGVVKAFDDERVTIDFNHPLAGKHLSFDVEIIEVKSISH